MASTTSEMISGKMLAALLWQLEVFCSIVGGNVTKQTLVSSFGRCFAVTRRGDASLGTASNSFHPLPCFACFCPLAHAGCTHITLVLALLFLQRGNLCIMVVKRIRYRTMRGKDVVKSCCFDAVHTFVLLYWLVSSLWWPCSRYKHECCLSALFFVWLMFGQDQGFLS